jgi:hypothetical protein
MSQVVEREHQGSEKMDEAELDLIQLRRDDYSSLAPSEGSSMASIFESRFI